MDRDRKRDNVNISYEWADAVVLLRELEMYKDIIAEHLPSVFYLYKELSKYVKEL
jgi:hypothetical protein